VRPLTLEDLYQQYRKQPIVIRDAIMRTNSHPTIINSVTRSTLRVLTRLVSRADKTDGTAPLRAKIDNLAIEAECDPKTVRRAISALVELGWLALPDMVVRNEYGVFSTRTYQFTERFCTLVCLPRPSVEPASSSPTGTEMSTGANKVDLSFKNDQRTIERETRKAKSQPVELTPVLDQAAEEFAMNRTGVAQLRGLAHRAGYALEDIIAVGRAYLQKAKATKNRAHGYLRAMIARKSDYAARAAQLRRGEPLKVQQAAEVEQFVQAHQGVVYETPDMRELIAIRPDGQSILHRIAGMDRILPLVTAQDVRHILDRIENGGMKPRGSNASPPGCIQPPRRSAVAIAELAAAAGILKAGRGRVQLASLSAACGGFDARTTGPNVGMAG
jgi:hypothetical protein